MDSKNSRGSLPKCARMSICSTLGEVLKNIITTSTLGYKHTPPQVLKVYLGALIHQYNLPYTNLHKTDTFYVKSCKIVLYDVVMQFLQLFGKFWLLFISVGSYNLNSKHNFLKMIC